jgi:hypothetical protein
MLFQKLILHFFTVSNIHIQYLLSLNTNKISLTFEFIGFLDIWNCFIKLPAKLLICFCFCIFILHNMLDRITNCTTFNPAVPIGIKPSNWLQKSWLKSCCRIFKTWNNLILIKLIIFQEKQLFLILQLWLIVTDVLT